MCKGQLRVPECRSVVKICFGSSPRWQTVPNWTYSNRNNSTHSGTKVCIRCIKIWLRRENYCENSQISADVRKEIKTGGIHKSCWKTGLHFSGTSVSLSLYAMHQLNSLSWFLVIFSAHVKSPISACEMNRKNSCDIYDKLISRAYFFWFLSYCSLCCAFMIIL